MKSKQIFGGVLISLALLSFSTRTSAQHIEAERDKIFEHVDLTRVPYGILEDYGLSPVSLIPYTKGVLDTTNYLNYLTLQQVMLGINSSLVRPHHSDSIRLDRVNSLNEAYYSKGVVPITLLRYDLCRFSEVSVHRGDVYPLNDQIRVKSALSTSPYEELHLFAASPFTSELFSLDVTFCIPQQLILSNSQSITRVEIQFQKGQSFRPIAIGEQIKYRYPTDGLKVVTLRVQQSGSNRWYTSHFPIVVSIQLETKSKSEISGLVEVPIKSNWRLHSGGTLQYKLSPHNHTDKFRKTLFIVEGFDVYPTVFSDSRRNWDINSYFSNEQFNRILDLGYDIAYLDYGDGMDDIRRNANLFQEALRYINSHKYGDEKNVVIGLSMGGLVASYGLRQMELSGEDHHTRKYISYDSPHMGANVPLGAFYMAYHWLNGDEFLKIRLATDFVMWIKDTPITTTALSGWIHRTCVRQLLPFDGSPYLSFLSDRCSFPLFSFTNPFDNIYNVSSKPNPEYVSFHREYERIGLPQKTYNVAFSNGSFEASNILTPSTPIVEAHGHVYGLFGAMPGLLAKLFYNPGFHLNWAPLTSSTFTYELYINAMPCSQPYFQDIALKKHYLFGWLTHTYHLSRMRVRVDNPLYSDVGAGGLFNLSVDPDKPLFDFELVDDDYKFWANFLDSELRVDLNTESFCFVPLNSSLGIPAGKKVINIKDARQHSPFDQLYTAQGTTSERHISFANHFENFITELKRDIPKDYRPKLDSTATICSCGTSMQVLNPIDGMTYKWHTSMLLDALNYGKGIKTTITLSRNTPTDVTTESQREYPFDQGFIYVEAYLNGIKYSTSDTCYAYIGLPNINASKITQEAVKNGYRGKYLPYPTVQIDWNRWGNITGVEWGYAQTSNSINSFIEDLDFVENELDQDAYDQILAPSMIRYEQQTQNNIVEWSDKLIGPDGEPIDPNDLDFKEPPISKEARGIPDRLLQFCYIPSRTLFDGTGEYHLTYRLINECGKSEAKHFTYQFMKDLNDIYLYPTVVTTEDAVLTNGRLSICSSHTIEFPVEFIKFKYTYGIWSSTGVLQRMGEVNLEEPLGIINLPRGQYLVKVWYQDAYKEFQVIKQ